MLKRFNGLRRRRTNDEDDFEVEYETRNGAPSGVMLSSTQGLVSGIS